jgi:hypothetical protein
MAALADCLSQQKILQNELPFPPYERTKADPAYYFAIICFGASFDFDYFVKRPAIRACEEVERRWIALRHEAPLFVEM